MLVKTVAKGWHKSNIFSKAERWFRELNALEVSINRTPSDSVKHSARRNFFECLIHREETSNNREETSNNKNLDIIWFTYSRGVRKSLFRFSRPKDTPVMGACLRHIETILCDRYFLNNFAFVCSEERWYTKIFTQYLISLFVANMTVQIVTQ